MYCEKNSALRNPVCTNLLMILHSCRFSKIIELYTKSGERCVIAALVIARSAATKQSNCVHSKNRQLIQDYANAKRARSVTEKLHSFTDMFSFHSRVLNYYNVIRLLLYQQMFYKTYSHIHKFLHTSFLG